MEIQQHIAELQQDGELIAAAAERGGLTPTVPPCPDWQVRDLLRHTGHVHRWATRYVVERLPGPAPDLTEAEILAAGPPDPELIGWFREGHASLVAALTDADPSLACWAFLPAPSPLAFWARRQAHETAIHRIDAELAAAGASAAGGVTPISAGFATDGIDELIMGFFGRDRKRLSDAQRAGTHQTVQVRTTDTGGEWLAALTADGTRAALVQRCDGAADTETRGDCTLTGPAAGLYLLLWNRADPATAEVEVGGDQQLLATWRAHMHVTWS